MNAWWQLWPSNIKPQTCHNLIEAGRAIEPRPGVVGFERSRREDPKIRRSLIRWPPLGERPWAGLLVQLKDLFHTANRNAFGFDLWELHEVQFTEYRETDEGHYDWHEDLEWSNPRMFHRKLSLVLQLSDPETYAGGDLELQHEPPDRERMRDQGTVIVFPSFHRHRVTPVKLGTRFSIVAWYTGPKFR